jgi:hypothetical protein
MIPLKGCIIATWEQVMNAKSHQTSESPADLNKCPVPHRRIMVDDMLLLFTIAKLWKQPRCPTTDEWIKKCGIYTQWNFMQP